MSKKVKKYNFTKASDINPNVKFKRVGCIPYFKIEDKKYYILMLDSKYKEYTDTGGYSKKNERWYDTAIRETVEESRGFFKFTYDDIIKSDICWRDDHKICISFVDVTKYIFNLKHMDLILEMYRISFRNGVLNNDPKSTLENCDMNYFSSVDIINICKQKKIIYLPVKYVFKYIIRNELLS